MGDVYGVIVAGGVGSRMGCKDKPKQFMMLDGKPIIIRTIEKFYRIEEFREIIVLCPAEWVSYTEELVRDFLDHDNARETLASDHIDRENLAGNGDMTSACRISVIPGGNTRNETIMRAIDLIEEHGDLAEDTVIVTHDSVRPFVTEEIIRENIAYALGDAVAVDGSGAPDGGAYGGDAGILSSGSVIRACTTAIPATDTILVSEDSRYISAMPDRTQMYQCQTPQTFPAMKLRRLYESLTDEEKDVLTDAARIFLMKGEKVHLIKGDISNIKITYPHDMMIAEVMMKNLDGHA